jgi:hypothetical protein
MDISIFYQTQNTFQIIIAVVYLWFELGAAVIAGLVVIVLTIPLNFWLSLKMKQLQVGHKIDLFNKKK